jgi:ubiquinone biosynthesis protein
MFAGEDYVRVPKVYWKTTTRRVLTMERMEGIKITDVAALEAAGLDRKEVARRNIAILLKAVLQEGFFHADPHAGNFKVQPNNVIAMMDFGIMGQLDSVERLGVVRLFVEMFQGNVEGAVEALSELGIATRSADKRKLIREFDRLRRRYYGLELEKIRARSFVEDLMGVAFAYRLKMPSNLVLVFKTIAMLEGISLQLDPDINVFEEVQPYVRDALFELQSPMARLKALAEQLAESTQALVMLPQQLQRMLEQIEVGEGNLSLSLRGLDEPTQRVANAAHRLALAILAAAFVIGPALIIPQLGQIFPRWQAAAVFLILAGFAMSVLITFGLLLSIWRSRR